MSKFHFNTQKIVDGIKFDSLDEADFYTQYVKPSGYPFDVHKHYRIKDKFPIGGMNMRSIRYTPDFVVYNKDRSEVLHVFDVKSSFSPYAIDSAAQIRFKLFASLYHIPIEIVVMRRHSFKMSILGLTTPFGRLEMKSIDYSVWDLIGR